MFPILILITFGKHIVEKLDSWAFWRYIQFQYQSWGLWEISKKVTIVLRWLKRTQQNVAARGEMTAADAAMSHLACVTCVFVNACHGAVAHHPWPGLRLATWLCSQITLDTVVKYTDESDNVRNSAEHLHTVGGRQRSALWVIWQLCVMW